jgi:glycogen debranching enzyme
MTHKTLAEEQQYYILGSSETCNEPPLILKHQDAFGVFDRFGDIDVDQRHSAGLFYRGTRFLSRLKLLFAANRPLLLSSTVTEDNVVLAVDLTNPDLYREGGILLPRGSLHIYRSLFLWEDTLYHRVRIRNFSPLTISIRLTIDCAADFADIFEVRGKTRDRRGLLCPPVSSGGKTTLEYAGLDGVARRTVIRCDDSAGRIATRGYELEETLTPAADHSVELTISFEIGTNAVRITDYDSGLMRAITARGRDDRACFIETSNEQFNTWIERSGNDVRMLTTQTAKGAYPYAGVPWFATPFGRDGILTALECLWMDPSMARGVLLFLTSTQATETKPEKDAEPGKVLHEARDGEMAALNEIPFGRYYGSVDATPLYLLLAAAYFNRTCDAAFLNEIWAGVDRALAWVDGYGDADQDGFVEYHRRTNAGLKHQGWKDSGDAIFHQDGTSAESPIALCEVQAYVYAAKMGLADAAKATGRHSLGRTLIAEAEELRRRFNDRFWSPRLGMYVLALDGNKAPCEVRSSNAGHALYCGVSSEQQAGSMAEAFLSERFYSGWGIRTIAEREARYNPMSYHNGSIWPHDNAVIAAGLSRYGFTELAARVMAGLFEAAACLEWSRLPELFCGFKRQMAKTPTWYPTACSPQAWSAAAAFLLLQASLGLSVDAPSGHVFLRRPFLPDFLERVDINNLAVGEAVVDLRLFRSGECAAVTVARRVGEIEVSVLC